MKISNASNLSTHILDNFNKSMNMIADKFIAIKTGPIQLVSHNDIENYQQNK